MKLNLRHILFALALLLIAAPLTSCNKKTGCKITEQATTKTNRKGKVKGKTQSNLFSKKQRRQLKKKKKK